MASTLLLNVNKALIRFGDKTLFEDLSFNIREGEKICLIGKNGAGKTTLMNIISGTVDMDQGERWSLQGSTTGYLHQEVIPRKGQTVRDFIFETLANQDGSHDYKIEKIVTPLDLRIHDDLGSLSGGQLRRAALARALVEEPDILLLDEPTNHLDLTIIEWLEDYLKTYRGAVVCVSHDKAFLSRISDKVFWLDRGKLKVCPRGFDFFEEWATMILEQEERELQNRQKVLDQEVEWASRGVKARRKRNVRRLELMKEEREKLKSDKRSLARMLAKIEYTPGEQEEATSKMIAQFYNVSKIFLEAEKPKIILDGFNLRIQRSDRFGIVGHNGSGKTSFLKLLTGELLPDTGTVKKAKDMNLTYFDQHRKDLKPNLTLQQVLCPNGSDYVDVMGKSRHVCGYLKDFLFEPQMAFQPVATLSGGQKNRLMLAKIMANPGNLLILDEPTNDLDMDTLDMLEEMLTHYTGTLLVVSHDRDFLDQTVSKILAFEGNGKVHGYIGGYQDYIAARQRQTASSEEDLPVRMRAITPKNKALSAPQDVLSSGPARLSYKQQYELDQLPGQIESYEKEINELELELADPDLYAQDAHAFNKLSRRLIETKHKLDQAETRWLELDDLRKSLSASGG